MVSFQRQVVPSNAQGLDNAALRPGSRRAIEEKPGSGRTSRPTSKK